MKVTGNNGVNITKLYNESMSKAVSDKEKLSKKYDTIEISRAGQEAAKFVSMAKEMPDIRTQKVNDIKSSIQNGIYKVSQEELALKILKTIKGEE